jgi:hypothetical protein
MFWPVKADWKGHKMEFYQAFTGLLCKEEGGSSELLLLLEIHHFGISYRFCSLWFVFVRSYFGSCFLQASSVFLEFA